MSASRVVRLLSTIADQKAEIKKLRELLAMKIVDLRLMWDKDSQLKQRTAVVSVSFSDLELVLAKMPVEMVRGKLHGALDLLINSAVTEEPALVGQPDRPLNDAEPSSSNGSKSLALVKAAK